MNDFPCQSWDELTYVFFFQTMKVLFLLMLAAIPMAIYGKFYNSHYHFSFSDVFFHFHLNIATQTFSWYFSDPHVNWLRNDFIFEKTRFNVVGRNDNIFLAQDDAVLQLLLNALSIRMGRKARAHALGTIKDHLWCSKLIIPDSPCNYVQIYWNCTTL